MLIITSTHTVHTLECIWTKLHGGAIQSFVHVYAAHVGLTFPEATTLLTKRCYHNTPRGVCTPV